jgi:hypothetical protein
MVFSLWLANNKTMTTKNTRQTLAILNTMRVRQCDAGRIVR